MMNKQMQANYSNKIKREELFELNRFFFAQHSRIEAGCYEMQGDTLFVEFPEW
jgi:hypothetical protein